MYDSTHFSSADAGLNAEWKRLLAAASAKDRTDLLAEQRVWITYRERACRLYANGQQSREGQVVHYPNCVAHIIEQRAAELAAYHRDLAGPQ